MYCSSQLPFLDTIWRSEWYLTNGSGHNQIKIHLTILYKIFSYMQQILSCGISNFCIPRMLEAFRRVSELQLPFLDAKRGLQTWYCTTNGSRHKHYKIDFMVQDYQVNGGQQVLSCRIFELHLLRPFIFHIYAFQAKNKNSARKNLISIQFPTGHTLGVRHLNGCSELQTVIPFCSTGAYEPKKAGIAHPGSYPSTISGLGVPSDSLCNVISVCNK